MEAGRFPGAMTTTSLGVQHDPTVCCLCGVWVDRGLYSGVAAVVLVFLVHPNGVLGCCLVLAH